MPKTTDIGNARYALRFLKGQVGNELVLSLERHGLSEQEAEEAALKLFSKQAVNSGKYPKQAVEVFAKRDNALLRELKRAVKAGLYAGHKVRPIETNESFDSLAEQTVDRVASCITTGKPLLRGVSDAFEHVFKGGTFGSSERATRSAKRTFWYAMGLRPSSAGNPDLWNASHS